MDSVERARCFTQSFPSSSFLRRGQHLIADASPTNHIRSSIPLPSNMKTSMPDEDAQVPFLLLGGDSDDIEVQCDEQVMSLRAVASSALVEIYMLS